VLPQSAGKLVGILIEIEITYTTTVVEFNTHGPGSSDGVMYVVSSVRVLRQKRQDISLYRQFMKGFSSYTGEASVVVKKQDSQTYNWRFKAKRIRSSSRIWT
jgi:hypothetical protein